MLVTSRPKTQTMAHQCRICFEEDENLVSPCDCEGSIKYVHRDCLDTWRMSTMNANNVTHCSVCKAKYRIKFSHNREMVKFLMNRGYVYARNVVVFNAIFFYLPPLFFVFYLEWTFTEYCIFLTKCLFVVVLYIVRDEFLKFVGGALVWYFGIITLIKDMDQKHLFVYIHNFEFLVVCYAFTMEIYTKIKIMIR